LVCGVLLLPPVKVTTFRSLWVMNLRNWKIDSGRKGAHDKLRVMTLAAYHVELGKLPGEISRWSLDEQARLAVKAQSVELEQVEFRAAVKRAREEEAVDVVNVARTRKLEGFWEVRCRLGDDLDGDFRDTPVFDRLANTELWWCSDEEAKLDSWPDVIKLRDERKIEQEREADDAARHVQLRRLNELWEVRQRIGDDLNGICCCPSRGLVQ